MSNGMNIPGDYATEQEALARRKEIAKALMQRGMQGAGQGQMISGHYIPPSWTEQLAGLADVGVSKYANGQIDKDSAASNANYQSGLSAAMRKYMDTKGGTTQQVEAQGPMPDGSAVDGMVPQEDIVADPRKAMAEAMASQYKPLQQLGMADMMAQGKAASGMSQKDLLALSGYDPKSKIAAALAGDPSLLQGEGKTHVIGDKLVREAPDGASKIAGDYSKKYGDLELLGYGADGKELYGQKEKGSGKIDYAPGGGTTVNVDTGDKGGVAFAKAAGEGTFKKMEASAEAAKKAQQSYEIFSNAATQIDKVKGGTGAELILNAKKLAQQLGAPIDDSITATEQIVAALGQAVLDNSKQLGTGNGFTDKDREFLQNIVMAKLPLDEKSLRRAVDLGLAGAINTIQGHQSFMAKVKGVKGADPAVLEAYEVPMPRFSFGMDRFDFDPKSNRITVKTSAGSGENPSKKPASPTGPNTGRKAELEAERDRLLKELGMK